MLTLIKSVFTQTWNVAKSNPIPTAIVGGTSSMLTWGFAPGTRKSNKRELVQLELAAKNTIRFEMVEKQAKLDSEAISKAVDAEYKRQQEEKKAKKDAGGGQ